MGTYCHLVVLVTRPRWWNDHLQLAVVAVHLHGVRAKHYRALLADRQIKRAAAIEAVRVTFAIECTWRAIAALAPAPLWTDDPETGGAWPYERIATLREIAAETRAAADASYGDFETVGLADAVDTLIWWETASPPARLIADCNIVTRLEAASRPPIATPARPLKIVRPAPAAPAPTAGAAGPAPIQTTLFGVAA